MARTAQTSKTRLSFTGILKGVGYAALLSVLALIVAVAVAATSRTASVCPVTGTGHSGTEICAEIATTAVPATIRSAFAMALRGLRPPRSPVIWSRPK